MGASWIMHDLNYCARVSIGDRSQATWAGFWRIKISLKPGYHRHDLNAHLSVFDYHLPVQRYCRRGSREHVQADSDDETRIGGEQSLAAAWARYPTIDAARLGTVTLLRDDRILRVMIVRNEIPPALRRMGGTVNSAPRTPAEQTAVLSAAGSSEPGAPVSIPGAREARAWPSRPARPTRRVRAAGDASRSTAWHVRSRTSRTRARGGGARAERARRRKAVERRSAAGSGAR